MLKTAKTTARSAKSVKSTKNIKNIKTAKTKATTRTAAKKPPLLFLHGFRGSHEGLVDIAVWLIDKGYECYYPDIPPFGESNTELDSYEASYYADFVADYIKSNKLDHPVLIGHSMGSLIAAATAEKYPELTNKKLILLAPISVKLPRPIAAIHPLATILPGKLVDYLTTKYLIIPRDSETLKETLEITYRCSMHYTSKSAVRASAKFSITHAISDFKFKKDTLLIAGENDRIVPKKRTEALAKALDAKMAFIKGAGHLLNYEKPHETAREITKFLAPRP